MQKVLSIRILSFLLVASMMFFAFVGCGDSTDVKSQDTTDASAATDTETPPEETRFTADIPAGTNMNGTVMRFLTSNWPGEAVWHTDDIMAEEINGAAMNDAIYYRNINVQELLNCVIEETNIDAGGDAYNALKQSVMAGDGSYQVWISRLQQYLPMAAEGNLTLLTDVPHINLEQPWWDQASVSELSFAHKKFIAVSDISTMDDKGASAIVFNKQLITDYNLDIPYDLVRNGTWTLDTFKNMLTEVAFDIDGNGKMDANDRFGFMYQRDTMEAFLTGGNEATCRKDENDIPYMTMNTERAITLLMNLTDFLYDQNICMNSMMLPGDFNIAMNTMFQNDQALFMWVRMVNVPELRTMESDFGILPTPKFTAEQDKYRTWINSWTGAGVCVPLITGDTNPEYVGIFIEAMGAESRNLVVPAYYDVMLSGIVARDTESTEMLDILYGNSPLGETIYDIGTTGCFGSIEQWIYMCMTYNADFASYAARMEKSVNKTIQKQAEKFAE